MDYSKLTDIEVEGIDMKDAPDFCDAFITGGNYDGRPLTDDEIETLNGDGSLVYDYVIAKIY